MKVAIIAFLVLAFYIFLRLRMTYRSTSMNVKKKKRYGGSFRNCAENAKKIRKG
ncbi:hypothetical protein P7H20_00700 [Paenibacillus larvae]|nr:hypothetical protein [Paenibacillus larvae]MDT2237806.1 hypothetical protein [Paenibacillus larvae]MDT2273698.1 hypothetical protein [Paenibacillus larvae]